MSSNNVHISFTFDRSISNRDWKRRNRYKTDVSFILQKKFLFSGINLALRISSLFLAMDKMAMSYVEGTALLPTTAVYQIPPSCKQSYRKYFARHAVPSDRLVYWLNLCCHRGQSCKYIKYGHKGR